MIIVIPIIISVALYNPGGWSEGTGFEEPFSGGIVLPPSEKDIQSVMDVTKASYDKSMIALIESDNDVIKAINYLK